MLLVVATDVHGFVGDFVVVINLEPNLAANPAEDALLLQREVDKAFVAASRELASVDLNPTEEMVFPAAAVAEAFVVVDLDVELVVVHVLRVVDGEIEHLVPDRVQVAELSGGSFLLSVEIDDDVGA